jgi:hypothetical protein
MKLNFMRLGMVLYFLIPALSLGQHSGALPLGSSLVVDYPFPNHWQHDIFVTEEGRLPKTDPKSSKAFETIQYAYLAPSDTLPAAINATTYVENNTYVDYYLPMAHVFDETMKSDAKYCAIEAFKKGNLSLLLHASAFNFPEQPPREYRYYYDRVDLVSYDEKGREIDGLPVRFMAGDDIMQGHRFFYIDTAMLIHTIDFNLDELDINYVRREKWQVLKSGHFVRYFDTEVGEIKGKEEEGKVLSHTKHGAWVERRFGMRFNHYFLQVEANYELGLEEGLWSYFEMKYQFTPNGQIVPHSGKKGRLLYTEVYEKGRLIKRTKIGEKEGH